MTTPVRSPDGKIEESGCEMEQNVSLKEKKEQSDGKIEESGCEMEQNVSLKEMNEQSDGKIEENGCEMEQNVYMKEKNEQSDGHESEMAINPEGSEKKPNYNPQYRNIEQKGDNTVNIFKTQSVTGKENGDFIIKIVKKQNVSDKKKNDLIDKRVQNERGTDKIIDNQNNPDDQIEKTAVSENPVQDGNIPDGNIANEPGISITPSQESLLEQETKRIKEQQLDAFITYLRDNRHGIRHYEQSATSFVCDNINLFIDVLKVQPEIGIAYLTLLQSEIDSAFARTFHKFLDIFGVITHPFIKILSHWIVKYPYRVLSSVRLNGFNFVFKNLQIELTSNMFLRFFNLQEKEFTFFVEILKSQKFLSILFVELQNNVSNEDFGDSVHDYDYENISVCSEMPFEKFPDLAKRDENQSETGISGPQDFSPSNTVGSKSSCPTNANLPVNREYRKNIHNPTHRNTSKKIFSGSKTDMEDSQKYKGRSKIDRTQKNAKGEEILYTSDGKFSNSSLSIKEKGLSQGMSSSEFNEGKIDQTGNNSLPPLNLVCKSPSNVEKERRTVRLNILDIIYTFLEKLDDDYISHKMMKHSSVLISLFLCDSTIHITELNILSSILKILVVKNNNKIVISHINKKLNDFSFLFQTLQTKKKSNKKKSRIEDKKSKREKNGSGQSIVNQTQEVKPIRKATPVTADIAQDELCLNISEKLSLKRNKNTEKDSCKVENLKKGQDSENTTTNMEAHDDSGDSLSESKKNQESENHSRKHSPEGKISSTENVSNQTITYVDATVLEEESSVQNTGLSSQTRISPEIETSSDPKEKNLCKNKTSTEVNKVSNDTNKVGNIHEGNTCSNESKISDKELENIRSSGKQEENCSKSSSGQNSSSIEAQIDGIKGLAEINQEDKHNSHENKIFRKDKIRKSGTAIQNIIKDELLSDTKTFRKSDDDSDLGNSQMLDKGSLSTRDDDSGDFSSGNLQDSDKYTPSTIDEDFQDSSTENVTYQNNKTSKNNHSQDTDLVDLQKIFKNSIFHSKIKIKFQKNKQKTLEFRNLVVKQLLLLKNSKMSLHMVLKLDLLCFCSRFQKTREILKKQLIYSFFIDIYEKTTNTYLLACLTTLVRNFSLDFEFIYHVLTTTSLLSTIIRISKDQLVSSYEAFPLKRAIHPFNSDLALLFLRLRGDLLQKLKTLPRGRHPYGSNSYIRINENFRRDGLERPSKIANFDRQHIFIKNLYCLLDDLMASEDWLLVYDGILRKEISLGCLTYDKKSILQHQEADCSESMWRQFFENLVNDLPFSDLFSDKGI